MACACSRQLRQMCQQEASEVQHLIIQLSLQPSQLSLQLSPLDFSLELGTATISWLATDGLRSSFQPW